MTTFIVVFTWFFKMFGSIFFMVLPIYAIRKKSYVRAMILGGIAFVTLALVWEPTPPGVVGLLQITERMSWLSVLVLACAPIFYLIWKLRQRQGVDRP